MKTREQQIEERLKQIPDLKGYRKVYTKAVSHKSRNAAVKAFCLECVGWEREEVKKCTDLACPLYGYRPYKT